MNLSFIFFPGTFNARSLKTSPHSIDDFVAGETIASEFLGNSEKDGNTKRNLSGAESSESDR